MRPAPITLTALLLLFATPQAHAADPTPPPCWPTHDLEALLHAPPNPEALKQTARLIEALSSPDFQTREQASKELEEKGPDAFPGIIEAARATQDPEAIARLQRLQITIEVPPNLPSTTAKAIRQYEANRQRILSQAAMPLAVSVPGIYAETERDRPFIEIVLSQESDPVLCDVLRKALERNIALTARMAIALGDLDKAQSILARDIDNGNWETRADYVALIALRNDGKINPKSVLATLPLNSNHHTETAVYLARAKAIPRAADLGITAADRYGAPVETSLIQSKRLSDLAVWASATNRYSTAPTTFYMLADDRLHVDSSIARSIDAMAGINEKINVANFSNFNTYLAADRAEEAITISQTRKDPRYIAFHLLCQQLRIREALAAIHDPKNAPLDLARQLNDLNLHEAAHQVLLGIVPHADANGRFLAGNEMYYADELERSGFPADATTWRNRAFEIIDQKTDTLPEIDQQRAQLQPRLDLLVAQRDAVEQQVRALESSLRAQMNNPAGNAISPQLQQKVHQLDEFSSQVSDVRDKLEILNSNHQQTEWDALFSMSHNPKIKNKQLADEAEQWLQLFKYEPVTAQACYNKTLRVMQPAISDEEANALLNELLAFVTHPPSNGSMGMTSIGTTELSKYAAAFQRLHRNDLAVKLIFAYFQNERDPSSFSILGDLMLQQNNPQLAAIYYQLAAPFNLTDPTLMYRLGLALSRNPATHAAGQQLLNYFPLLVLGSISDAQAVVAAMRRFDSEDAASAWFYNWVTRFGNPYPNDLNDIRTRAIQSAESKKDFATALELQKQALFSPPKLHPEDFSNIMANLALYHRLRALDALQRHDPDTLIEALNGNLNNGPPDIDLLEKTLPTLQKSNPVDAQKILQRALDRLQPITRDYPEIQKYQEQLKHLQALQMEPTR